MSIRKIILKQAEIFLFSKENTEYISLADITKSKDSERNVGVGHSTGGGFGALY